MKRLFLFLILSSALAFSQGMGGTAGAGGKAGFGGGVGGGGASNTLTFDAVRDATDSTSGTTVLDNFPAATVGALLVVHAVWDSSTLTAAMSGGCTGSWTALGSRQLGVGPFLTGFSGEAFYCAQAAALSGGNRNITLTTSGTTTFRSFNTVAYTYTGTVGVDGTPAYSTTAAVAGVATVSGVTTSWSGGLIIAGCLAVDTTCTAGATYTSRDAGWNGVTGGRSESKTGGVAGAQTATFGTGTTDNVILNLSAFQAH